MWTELGRILFLIRNFIHLNERAEMKKRVIRIVFMVFSTCLCFGQNTTNTVYRSNYDTKYWMPPISGNMTQRASVIFENDFHTEIKAFDSLKDKYRPLIKRWACIFLKGINEKGPKTLYVGPFTDKTSIVKIYDYEGKSFWQVGNVKSFEAPEIIHPALVTRVHTFDFLLGGTFDEDARASQAFLIKWQVANCVMDGMRIDISAEEIANVEF